MQNEQEDKKVKVNTKRIRGRNLHDTITQVLELANTSEGWAVTKATMLGMGADVYLERSALQGNEKQAEDVKPSEPTEKSKVVSDVKNEEKVVEADTSSEKPNETADDETKPKTRSTRGRSKAK